MLAGCHCLSLFLVLARPDGGAPTSPTFHGSAEPVPEAVRVGMLRYSWREGCPTPIADLAYLRLAFFGFDGEVHEGQLVVHRDLADEVVAIFRALFQSRFPIEKMQLIDAYHGDDDAAMADNNTSAFNCRFVPGKPGVFSRHSQGRAIDINPRLNPMVKGKSVTPPAGVVFLNQASGPGILRQGAAAVGEFTRRGWVWGGAWQSLKDYQHFEK